VGPPRLPAPKTRRIAAALLVCAGLGVALSACSSAGPSLAQRACVHVDASIRLFKQAEHTRDVSSARQKAAEAAGQLSDALPLAARATSANPAYNPLMTTLQEIGRTSEANLIPALRAQCSAADNSTAQTTTARGPGSTGSSTSATTGVGGGMAPSQSSE